LSDRLENLSVGREQGIRISDRTHQECCCAGHDRHFDKGINFGHPLNVNEISTTANVRT
jgi:hypothetical protein